MPQEYNEKDMRIKEILKSAFLICIVVSGGCKSGNSRKDAIKEYAFKLESEGKMTVRGIDSCNNAITSLRELQDAMMPEFTTVTKAREAASYIIYTSFKDNYPPKSTGLIARLADNGQFELIASLTGSKFDQITVQAPNASATSDVVPADQALNYTVDGLTTVLFTGQKADEIGKLIADNELNNIKVVYLNGGIKGSWNIPVDTRNMIMNTYELYFSQREINRLERKAQMLNERLRILRLHDPDDMERPQR